MSDMSFKQAKELAERLELSEITLKQVLEKIDVASKNFDNSLEKQENILNYVPRTDKKLTFMKILVGVNVGFIVGLIVAQYIF
jgi:tetrahydromethanopterin S-methyltransferase subunit B